MLKLKTTNHFSLKIRLGNGVATKQTSGSNDVEDESSETPIARTSTSIVEDGNIWGAEGVSTNPNSQVYLGDHCAKRRSLRYAQTWKSSIKEKLECGECHTGLEFVKEGDQLIDIPHVLCVSCLCYVLTENSYELECEPEPHSYCGTCLDRIFDIAMRSDTSLFPPRCCGKPIPVELRRERVSRNNIKEFDLRVEELSAKNPTYCFNMRCAGFIREKQIKANVGTCIHCGTKTCTVCKGAEHQEELCLQDKDTILLKDEAKRRNWQQCGNCKNMVELSMGCYHMTCRCRYEFCYLCGVKWKGCVCPHFVEEQLIQRDNGAANGAAAPRPPHGEHEHNRERERGADCGVCGASYLPGAMQCTAATCRRARRMRWLLN